MAVAVAVAAVAAVAAVVGVVDVVDAVVRQDNRLVCPHSGRSFFFLQLHINAECNLHCLHCYQDFPPGHQIEKLTPDEIYALLDQYHSFLDVIYGAGTVYFTGGEPLLDPHLPEYIRKARACNLFPRVLSNGTLITPQIAQKLAEAGVGVVQVSLDGLQDTHDQFRGNGSFEKATRGLNNFHEAGIPTAVMITLDRKNASEIEALLQHCIQHHVTRWSFGRLVPTGSGEILADEVMSPGELKQFFKRVRKLERKFGRDIEFAIHDPLWMRFRGIKDTHGCSVAESGICVVHNGDIMPCRRMNMVVGNIRKMNLLEAWHLPVMQQLRKREKYAGKCSTCKSQKSCGGCRAIARAVTGSELSSDPQCFY